MNYYPFHIGDYSAATRHLSWDEDAAYRRLLDVFYTTEKPLPAELRAVCRLVLATSETQREAVQAVLEEFWTLTDSGWINKRALQELERMRERQSASDEKNAHERERMRRHRDRRAELFEALRSAGVTPAWDISMADLQRLYNAHCSSPATDLKREQVVFGVAPATAIPTPTPTPTPTPVESTSVLSAHAREAVEVLDDPPPDPTPASRVCIALKAMGVSGVNPGNQRLRMLLSAGADLPEFLGFVDKARSSAPGREFAYILGAVEGERKRVAATVGTLAGGRMPNKQELLEASNRRVAEEWAARGAVQ